MTVHYDSNVAIALLNANADFRNRHDQLIASGEQVCFSGIVVFELWFGVAKRTPSAGARR